MKSNAFWTKKYKQNIGKMIGVCYRYVLDRDLAEDLAHDAFLKAIEKADSFRGLGRFDAWLMRITVNTLLQYLRNNRSQTLDNVPEEQLEEQPAEEECEENEVMAAIRKADFTQVEIVEAVGQLPEHHRVVFNLYVFDHFTHKQIAEERGISENTSKSHLARARKELQQILFNKTKNRKRPMMVLWFLFPKIGKSAIYQWCQHQLADFAMEPIAPLSATQLSAAAGSVKLFSAIGLRAASIPLAIGTTAAAVGTVMAVELREPTVTPADSLPQTNVVQQDTLVADMDTIPSEVVIPVQVRPDAVRHQNVSSANENASSDSASVLPEPAAPPVVVKKVIHKTTVVIKDTNNKR